MPEIALRPGLALLFGLLLGLTVAANIRVCGAVGLACGAGHHIIAALTLGFTASIVTGIMTWRAAKHKDNSHRFENWAWIG